MSPCSATASVFYISSPWSTFWRVHTRRERNWFLDASSPRAGSPRLTRPVVDSHSISKMLEEITPFVATAYAGIGALVDHEESRLNFFRRVLGTRNFSGQISQVLRARRFPDLVLISIGHNNIDWAWRCPPDELNAPERRLRNQCQQFRQNYTRQLRCLLGRARNEKHRVSVIVFGLINFESYFKGRESAERLRQSDRRLYPHLETTYKYFISFHPD